MRVLHVIPSLAVRDGGPSRIAIGMCHALQERGIETLIATTVAKRDAVAVPPSGIVTLLNGVPVIGFSRRGLAFKYSAALSRWVRANVRHFDVVHIHAVFSHSSFSSGRACRLAGVPYVLRPLGSLDPWALARRRLRKRLLQPSMHKLVRGASALHFTTDEEAGLAGVNGSRSVVIPPGVDDRCFDAGSRPMSEREPLIVVIARLHPVKRLDALIKAFHAIAKDPSRATWRLVLAGDGEPEYRRELERAAAGGAGAGRIEFAGWLDESAKLALLERASLTAVPSFQENFGLGLAEALACGVPAIVARGVNLSGTIDLAGAGWRVGYGDDELRDALVSATQDAQARQKRSIAARQLASQYHWTNTAAALEALYVSLRPARVGDRR